MAQAALRHILLGLAATGLLMGCVAGTGDSDGPAPTVTTTKAVGKGQEVEAPEVFQTTDSALWDGRPSLGGIWVASAQAVDPERVVMFNPATGKSVTGALFRRERDNPGPALQLSSDAAEALGLLAGQPAEIRVTALRKTEPEAAVEEAPAAPVADVAPPAEAEAEPPAEAEAAATAAAALAAADAAGDAGAVVSGDPAAADTTVEQPPKRKTWKERRAEAKAAREAKKAAAAAATADTAGVEAPEADVSTDGIGVAAIETAPLDARAAEAATVAADETAAAAPAEEPARPLTRREKRAAAEAAAAAQAAEPVAPEPQAPTGRPIQVASFSKEENATRAVEALAKVGVSAQTRKSEANGKVVWGVIALGDDAMLQSIKSAGFADAFFLK